MKELQKFRIISPIILAILYFGASRASIKFGSRDICIYDRILSIFVSFLSIPVNQDKILRAIKDNQIDSLEEFYRQSIDNRYY